MKKETIKEYTILFQYMLFLKEPTYIFLIQIFQHLSPETWWEDFIEPVLQRENKDNFKYLDMSDLLNVFKINWEVIFKYLDNNYQKFKYNNEYKIVNKVHKIRTIVAHANDIDMSPSIFVDSLSCLLDYARIIRCDITIIQRLEIDWAKYISQLPMEERKFNKEETLMRNMLSIIDNKVLLNAINCETLDPDIKLSVDRTALRLHSMRTLEEMAGFFNNAMRTERGLIVEEELHKNNLLAFEDIKDDINREMLKDKITGLEV
jgi:Asp-tRNA(Asn)/Glu-tRNA(Gln) amidotransferase C subunit